MHDDQAQQLRKLMADRRRAVRTVAVCSGKGGVGKTVLSVNLGICLAASNIRALLIDGDLGLANADVLLNMQPRATLAQVISGQCSLDQAIVDGPGGLKLLAGASGMARLADLDHIQRNNMLSALEELDVSTQIALLDTGAGIARNVSALTSAADEVIVVSTPEPTALTDAYAMIKTLVRAGQSERISVMVNMVRNRHEARMAYQRLATVARRFLGVQIQNLGYVLRDEHVAISVRQRVPFVLAYPRCQASYCVMDIAARLVRGSEVAQRREGLLRRVARLFG